MSTVSADFADVQAVLPGSENDEEREKLILQAAETSAAEEKDLSDEEDDDLDEVLHPGKPSKKKLFAAFAGFVLFFVFLLAIVCWFFGIGFFAAAKTKPVDRTSKTHASSAPVTEEEKLKMALNMVAEKNPSTNTEKDRMPPIGSDAGVWGQGSSLTPPSDGESGTANNLTLPPDSTRTGSISTQPSLTEGTTQPQYRTIDSEDKPTSLADPGTSGKSLRSSDDSISAKTSSNRKVAPAGRSLFFGKERKPDSLVVSPTSVNRVEKLNGETGAHIGSIPFGSILPVRLVGSVYTLRNSAGFVRMELTRSVEGKGFAYPAGTVVVGTLRGSEYKRAFISVVGLIDSRTGNLVKFNGEVLGNDGASGMSGRRRKISSAWSRALVGLRDAGTAALGALGNLRSGGTVVISDSTQKASGVLTGQISDLVGSKQKSDEFVEVTAGTNGFVLVTNLPGEDSNKTIASTSRTTGSGVESNATTLSGLTDEELADLFSGASSEKLRAAIPRMTPEFRKLAEQALGALKSE